MLCKLDKTTKEATMRIKDIITDIIGVLSIFGTGYAGLLIAYALGG
jgi:hypothetical protein